MNRIASRFSPTGNSDEIALQDFLTFRQALNVASADQRLLVVVNGDKEGRELFEPGLRAVFSDDEIVGKFHLDFLDRKTDRGWSKEIEGTRDEPGIIIIRSGTFGLDGKVMAQLPLTENAEEIKAALLAANQKYASLEERKTYSQHVMSGRRQGIYFENEIPYGEDRDGDGKADSRSSRRR